MATGTERNKVGPSEEDDAASFAGPLPFHNPFQEAALLNVLR
jgi:hypothetical protein